MSCGYNKKAIPSCLSQAMARRLARVRMSLAEDDDVDDATMAAASALVARASIDPKKMKAAERAVANFDRIRLDKNLQTYGEKLATMADSLCFPEHRDARTNCSIFLERILPTLELSPGVTVLAPVDDAFSGFANPEDAFDSSSKLLHVLPGLFTVTDLIRYNTISSTHPDPKHALRFRFDTRGRCAVGLCSDRPDPLLSIILHKDFPYHGGSSIVHIVSNILFAPASKHFPI